LRITPHSPLFPYTTLFRSEFIFSTAPRVGRSSRRTANPLGRKQHSPSGARGSKTAHRPRRLSSCGRATVCEPLWPRFPHLGVARSEEHTSELQSRFDLVCR